MQLALQQLGCWFCTCCWQLHVAHGKLQNRQEHANIRHFHLAGLESQMPITAPCTCTAAHHGLRMAALTTPLLSWYFTVENENDEVTIKCKFTEAHKPAVRSDCVSRHVNTANGSTAQAQTHASFKLQGKNNRTLTSLSLCCVYPS